MCPPAAVIDRIRKSTRAPTRGAPTIYGICNSRHPVPKHHSRATHHRRGGSCAHPQPSLTVYGNQRGHPQGAPLRYMESAIHDIQYPKHHSRATHHRRGGSCTRPQPSLTVYGNQRGRPQWVAPTMSGNRNACILNADSCTNPLSARPETSQENLRLIPETVYIGLC